MKEFMLLIRNEAGSKENFTSELHKAFVEKCEVYIEKLTMQGKLIAAQPLVREGCMISGFNGDFQEHPYAEGKDVMVGYYHIFADSLEDAIGIAKENPEFYYTQTARIEVRPVKMKEEVTGYVYPKNN